MNIGLGIGIPFRKSQIAAVFSAFSPASLFAAGEPGAWWDPSDMSTLFQDSAGTTPVTAVEQPVGLMLDKSKGLVLGPELVTNGDFSNGTTGWTLGSGWAINASELVKSSGSTNAAWGATSTCSAGKLYQITFSASNVINACNVSLRVGTSGSASSSFSFNVSGQVTGYIFATAGHTTIQFLPAGSPFTASIDNISVRELPGNHATQPTATSRPVVSARVNVLERTEDLSNAYWTASGLASRVVSGEFTTIAETNTAGVHSLTKPNLQTLSPVSTPVTVSASFKAGTRRYVQLQFDNGVQGVGVVIDTQNWTIANITGAGTVTASSIASMGGGEYRVSVTGFYNSGTGLINAAIYGLANSTQNSVSYTGNGSTIIAGKADLRVANDGVGIPPYQRVNTATDYDSTGFPVYLRADGVDDGMVTNSINFTATDKMTVVAGVRKLSDAVAGVLTELSADANFNAGSFFTLAPQNSSNRYATIARGSASLLVSQTATTGATAGLAPDTAILTATHDIAGDLSTIRRNTVAGTSGTGDKGTGNYGNYPLYLFRRGGTSAPFNGRFYGMTIVNKLLSTTELEQLETYTNNKTRAFA